MVQWLRICAFPAGGASLVLGQGTKIPHALPCVNACACFVTKKKKKRESEMGITLIVGNHICAITQWTRGSDTTD